MAFIQHRCVTAGQLISGSFEELAAIKGEIGLYLLCFLIAGLVADFAGPVGGLVSIAATSGYFAGQYWLYRTALSRRGITVDHKFKVFSFFFMAAVLILPIYFGVILLVIPGILLASKWIMAPAYLVAEEMNLFEAIGASWRASSNNLLPIALAFTLIVLIWLGLFAAIGWLTGGFENFTMETGLGSGSGSMSELGWVLLPLMLMGLSLAAYRSLSDQESSYVAVFE
jgi:hypothetical protein